MGAHFISPTMSQALVVGFYSRLWLENLNTQWHYNPTAPTYYYLGGIFLFCWNVQIIVDTPVCGFALACCFMMMEGLQPTVWAADTLDWSLEE